MHLDHNGYQYPMYASAGSLLPNLVIMIKSAQNGVFLCGSALTLPLICISTLSHYSKCPYPQAFHWENEDKFSNLEPLINYCTPRISHPGMELGTMLGSIVDFNPYFRNPNVASKQKKSKADELKERPRFNATVSRSGALGGFKPQMSY